VGKEERKLSLLSMTTSRGFESLDESVRAFCDASEQTILMGSTRSQRIDHEGGGKIPSDSPTGSR
jgi:hypothetical protein